MASHIVPLCSSTTSTTIPQLTSLEALLELFGVENCIYYDFIFRFVDCGIRKQVEEDD